MAVAGCRGRELHVGSNAASSEEGCQPTFQLASSTVVDLPPRSLRTGDIDGDGNLDIAISGLGYGELRGDGQGDLAANGSTVSTEGSFLMVVGDLDGDGRLDKVRTQAGPDHGELSVTTAADYYGRFYALEGNPVDVAIADTNHDGRSDLIALLFSQDFMPRTDLATLLGRDDGSFDAPTTVAGDRSPFIEAYTPRLAVDDLNADGYPDVAVTNTSPNTISVFLGDGDGSFQLHGTIYLDLVGQFEPRPNSIVLGDLNGDGMSDMAVANNYIDAVRVWLGNGDGTFQEQGDYPTSPCPTSIGRGDMNGDGKVDLAVATGALGYVNVLLGRGDGTFMPALGFGIGLSDDNFACPHPNSLVIGNMNGDRMDDIVAGNGDVRLLFVMLAACENHLASPIP